MSIEFMNHSFYIPFNVNTDIGSLDLMVLFVKHARKISCFKPVQSIIHQILFFIKPCKYSTLTPHFYNNVTFTAFIRFRLAVIAKQKRFCYCDSSHALLPHNLS